MLNQGRGSDDLSRAEFERRMTLRNQIGAIYEVAIEVKAHLCRTPFLVLLFWRSCFDNKQQAVVQQI
jgi:hypothetical protein